MKQHKETIKVEEVTMEKKFYSIIEAVNELYKSIKVAKEKKLKTFTNIDVLHTINGLKVMVCGSSHIDGRPYTALELSIKDGIVYWENIPVGEEKDLLLDSVLLHKTTNEL